MSHYLTTVRDAVVAAVTGLATTGSRVYEEPVYPLTAGPALIVSAWSPAIVAADMDVATLQVDADVGIECVAKAASGATATLDTIAAEVQAALAALTAIGGKQVSTVPVAIDRPFYDMTTEQPVARRLLLYRIAPLFTSSADPTSLS